MINRKFYLIFISLFLLGTTLYIQFPKIKKKYYKSLRISLFKEIKPVSLTNCNFKRYGGAADGGYLLCENLLHDIKSIYSYGIAGEDNWGCELTSKLELPVHQYDCFDTRRPACPGADYFNFQEECVSSKEYTIDHKKYNSFLNQIRANRDEGKKLLIKMDIEGSEWETLANTPDEILQNIDQMVIEFHDVNTNPLRELLLIRKLKNIFYITNIHFNNYACQYDFYPLPSSVFQALLVNKRLGNLQSQTSPETLRNPLDHPDNPNLPDCQINWQ